MPYFSRATICQDVAPIILLFFIDSKPVQQTPCKVNFEWPSAEPPLMLRIFFVLLLEGTKNV